MPVAYGQHQDSSRVTMPPPRGGEAFGHHPSQPLMHALPGGGGMSPFFGNAPSAPGFPVQPPGQSGIMPLPYNASNPSPAPFTYSAALPPHAYTHSGALYQPYDYNQRAHTTGSMFGGPPQPVNLTPASTSYSTPYDHTAQVDQKKSNADYADDCFNIFWLFFLLGPLTWVCGLFGICSDKQSERVAGFVSGICLILVVIAAVIVITQTPNDSGSDGDS